MAGIFISYRRDDVAGQVGRLFGRLAQHYGDDFVFMDVESIDPSQAFEAVISNRIASCDLMLIAIGPRWVGLRTGLAPDAKDFVHLEISAALGTKRAVCPVLIDRRDALDPSSVPAEFREVLGRQISEIRHSTFDRDVDALIAGLERQGIRPPAAVGRRRFETALGDIGGPFAWFASVSRALGPYGALALMTVAGLAGGAGAYQFGHGRGVTEADLIREDAVAQGKGEVTAVYEMEISKERREGLKILGLVTDGAQGVEDATVTLTNVGSGKTKTVQTDTRGIYLVNLEAIEIAEGDTVQVEVVKTGYRPTRELVKFHDGFREFRAVLRKE